MYHGRIGVAKMMMYHRLNPLRLSSCRAASSQSSYVSALCRASSHSSTWPFFVHRPINF